MYRRKRKSEYFFIPHTYEYYVVLCSFMFYVSQAQRITSTIFKGNGKFQLGPSRVKVTTETQWIQESLDVHNHFRSLHGSPPLVLNHTLSEISQYYANYLLEINLKKFDSKGVRREEIYFEHNPETSEAGIGENLYYSVMTAPVEPIPSSYAVILWYEEIKDYEFSTAQRKSTSDPKAKIGHLTQLLWKSTSQLGTAYASAKLPKNQTVVFVVANYFKQGNVILRGNEKKLYLENVLPPTISTEEVNAAIVSKNVESWWKGTRIKQDTPESWRESSLEIHNEYRMLHGSQPLRVNKDLCKVSQLWANSLVDKGIHFFNSFGVLHQVYANNFVAVQICKFGENLMSFITKSETISAKDVLKLWYDQSLHYDFSTNQKSSDASEDVEINAFEQILWNSTTEFCMSYSTKKAKNGKFIIYVVANYYPSVTNRREDKGQNIFPRRSFLSDGEGDGDSGAVWIYIFTVLFIIVCMVVAVYTIFRYKKSWYESVLNRIGLKK